MERNFIELTIGGIDAGLVKDQEVVLRDKHDNRRLYLKPADGDGDGFYATAVEFVSSTGEYDNNWEDPELVVEVTMECIALFDGIRHLYFNSDKKDPSDNGYLYYPDINFLSKITALLSKFERQYCKRADNYTGLPEKTYSDNVIQLSVKPLELCPLAVVNIDLDIMVEVEKLMGDYGLILTPPNNQIAPSIYDAVAQQAFVKWLDNQDAETYLALLLQYKLVTTKE